MQARKRRGFTLIEILVVIAISALMSSIAIIYSHTGEHQIAVSVEAAKIAQLILQAKELSISTYSGAGTSCAYGVAINYVTQTYSLFTYNPPLNAQNHCPSAASTTAAGNVQPFLQKYAPSSWQLPVAKGVKMAASSPQNDVLTLVMFYPPNPATLISLDGGTSFLVPGKTVKVYLSDTSNAFSTVVTVSPAGQVQF